MNHTVFKILFVYIVFAALWIWLSDKAILLITRDPEQITFVAIIKGWLFVVVTSSLLAFMIRGYLKKLAAINDQLRVSEEKWRFIINRSPDGIIITSMDGYIEQASAKVTEMLGYGREEFIGKHILDFIEPSYHPKAKYLIGEMLKGNYTGEGEYLAIRKDGTRFFIETNAEVLRNTQGESTNLFFISRDISRRKNDEKVIHVSEARLKRAELASKSGNWELHLDTQVIAASDGARKLYGLNADQFEYALIKKIPLTEYRQLLDAALRNLVEKDETYDIEFKIKTADTGKIIDIHSQAVFDKEKRIVFGIIQDVTDRKQSDARLQLAASVFTHAREGIMITDVDGTIVEVNDTFTRITGYSHKEALGKNPRILKSGRQPKEYYVEMWRTLLEKGYWDGEVWNRRKSGEVYAEMISISAVRDATGTTQNYVALFTDITPMKEHQKQLEHIAHYDVLTNLPNRILLADRLKQAMIQSQRRNQFMAVAYLDLDGFKSVNDKYGHDIGDEMLIEVANRIKEALREGDTLARLGGDEFVAVLVDLEQSRDYEPLLSRLLQAAANPVSVDDIVLQVSASIGVTLYPQDGADADQLMRHADQAMYQAKQAGKNRYHFFDVDQDAAIQTQSESLKHIRRALDQREFVLYYQPKVNMKSGALIGAEALIRWQHPERGLLPPATFLPIIEDHAISAELGEWVIEAGLDQIREWQAAGISIPISVNVGALQMQKNDFVTRLAALLSAHADVPPSMLELEILETSALGDVPHICEVMNECRKLGVNFALDDFGTGYSSLTYLKQLPADVLKIDQSFVIGMLSDPDHLAIVKGVMGLASAFRRKIIAEGVETEAHAKALLSLGCEFGQGYGIARPMPALDLLSWATTCQESILTWKS